MKIKLKNWPKSELLKLGFSIGVFIVVFVVFSIYVQAEKKVDLAYQSQYVSHLLANELRQSSDDLTRMARAYVITNNPIYKKYYQDIIDIRNGSIPRPHNYEYAYWDLVLGGKKNHKLPENGKAISLLEQMRLEGFSTEELNKLSISKKNSDQLTTIEFKAMKLIEENKSKDNRNQIKASEMMYDDSYLVAKASIMQPIKESYELMNERTLKSIRNAQHNAFIFRCFFYFFTFSAIIILLRAYVVRVHEIYERKQVGAELLLHRNHLRELVEEQTLELTTRTSQLEVSNNRLQSFSYSVAHDLRSPLRAIDGWSLALEEDYGHLLDDKAKKYLWRIRSEGQRMGELTDDLLKLAQISRSEFHAEFVNLSQIAFRVINRLVSEFPDRKVDIVIGPEIITKGDAHFLEMVLTNLLSNAWKFSSKKEDVRIEFGQIMKDGKLVYFVKDNGAGFSMDSAHNLFEPFQRLHRQSEFPGTGIGLATVKQIIELHKGKVWVEAAINEGATFFFTVNEIA